MSSNLTVKLVAMIKDHGVEAFKEAYDTATSIFGIFEDESRKVTRVVARPRRPRRQRRKILTARELASADDWTSAVGKFFVLAEKNGSTEVPMRDVVKYIVNYSQRKSVTGGAYGRYIKAVESIGWIRNYTGKDGVKARTFVKVA